MVPEELEEYRRVAMANRLYYSRTAALYDATESCVCDHGAQKMLRDDLDCILRMWGGDPRGMRCLDACAGSGNVSLKLLARGAQVTACDVSPELLKILEVKASQMGLTPTIVCGDIVDFLLGASGLFDLIVFSSALHHLANIPLVLKLSGRRLAPGGLLYTVFDPIPRRELGMFARGLLAIDYLVFKISRHRADFIPGLRRRIRRALRSRQVGAGQRKAELDLQPENLGVLAEYHIEEGVDDEGLLGILQAEGLEEIWHLRYAGARYGVARGLLTRMNQPTSFRLLARKPAALP
jgi:2-polyprenyl-3-methyl-5-hydroxy-6-metoxy-1,4-benzoquinol methylase